MPEIPLGIAMAVLGAESYPLRFEKFANDIVSQIEGGRLVSSTSPTYDRGRDGRSIDPGGEVTVCCSLEEEISDKAASDIRKITQRGPTPRKVYFCSNRNLTEDRRIRLTEEIRRLLPAGVAVEAFGARQLATAAQRFEEPLRRHYRVEIDDTLHAFAMGPDNRDAKAGLQLALSAAGHPDSVGVRQALYRSAILTVLVDGAARNVAECNRDVAAYLRLARGLPEASVREHLNRMIEAGDLQFAGERYMLSDAGKLAAAERDRVAAAELLRGRNAVRAQVEAALGYRLDDEQYGRIWAGLQERTATFFFTRGQAMVAALAALLEDAARVPDLPEMAAFVREVAAGAAETGIDGTQAEQIRVAVTDLFAIREGSAFEWLVSTAASFLALCSMGLEATSGEQLKTAVSKMALVPDTDVLLSFLCEGEPEHRSVQELLRRWKAIGGDLQLAKPVLLEVAHHAWIAPNDFREVERMLPGSEIDRALLIRNAFVRAFAALMAKGAVRNRNMWASFIGQFRGTNSTDAAPVRRYLLGVLPFADLPGVSRSGRDLRGRVRGRVLGERESRARDERELKIIRDKAERDADLYVSIVEYARRLRNADPASTCLLVTSSGRLRDLERSFPEEQHEELVLPIPVVLYVLSLIPGVSLGMDAMRALLFERRLGIEDSDLQRVVLRSLRASQNYSLPWASRTLLEKEVRSRIVAFARSEASRKSDRASREKELENAIVEGREREAVSTILSEALANVGADTSKDRELAQARERIRELERQLARRHKSSPASAKGSRGPRKPKSAHPEPKKKKGSKGGGRTKRSKG